MTTDSSLRSEGQRRSEAQTAAREGKLQIPRSLRELVMTTTPGSAGDWTARLPQCNEGNLACIVPSSSKAE